MRSWVYTRYAIVSRWQKYSGGAKVSEKAYHEIA